MPRVPVVVIGDGHFLLSEGPLNMHMKPKGHHVGTDIPSLASTCSLVCFYLRPAGGQFRHLRGFRASIMCSGSEEGS